jgi:periplasmic protein TonB
MSTVTANTQPKTQRLPILLSVLLGHITLLGFFLTVSQSSSSTQHRPAVPLPMVMVQILPKPLPMGSSQQEAALPTDSHSNASLPIKQAISQASVKSNNSSKKPLTTSSKVKQPTPSPRLQSPSAKPVALPQEARQNDDSQHAITTPVPSTTSATTTESQSNSSVSKQKEGTDGSPGKAIGLPGSNSNASGGTGTSSSPRFGAAYLNNPAPVYPPIAKRLGEQGRVLLRVLVSPDGMAKEVSLHSSSGSESLDEAAIRAVRRWRFVPAKQGNNAVTAWVQVPIVFKLD